MVFIYTVIYTIFYVSIFNDLKVFPHFIIPVGLSFYNDLIGLQ